jgi:hypothetical protein
VTAQPIAEPDTMPLALAAPPADRTAPAVIADMYAAAARIRECALLGRYADNDDTFAAAERNLYRIFKADVEHLWAQYDGPSPAALEVAMWMLRRRGAALDRAVADHAATRDALLDQLTAVQASMPAAAGRALRAVTR